MYLFVNLISLSLSRFLSLSKRNVICCHLVQHRNRCEKIFERVYGFPKGDIFSYISTYSVFIIAGEPDLRTCGQLTSTRSTGRCSIVSQRGTSTRSTPRSTASSSGTSTRSIGSAGTDSSRGSIITWRTGSSDVKWRRWTRRARHESGLTKGE